MPRGIRKQKPAEEVKKPIVEAPKVEIKPEVKPEPKKPVLEPLAAGQQYFESPEGEILIGDADKDRLWSRKTNSGKGGWINPRR